MAASIAPIPISLNLVPAFYHKTAGLHYGEAYYFDAAHRAAVEKAENEVLASCLGEWNVGTVGTSPAADLAIQSVDLTARTQGAEWRFPEDAVLESWGTPWAGLTVTDIEKIDPATAAAHPIVDRILEQYRELQRLYGERADVFNLREGTINVHTPYTAAHKLYGEELFVLMMDDPAGARVVLDKAEAIDAAIFGRIRKAIGGPPPVRAYLGDCSASLLSPAVYEEVVLPSNLALVRGLEEVWYHSCGPSTHLLPLFARLPNVSTVQLGQGTDLGLARRLFPKGIWAFVDAVVVRNETPESVARTVKGIRTALDGMERAMVLAWALDGETPVANLKAMYRAAYN